MSLPAIFLYLSYLKTAVTLFPNPNLLYMLALVSPPMFSLPLYVTPVFLQECEIYKIPPDLF